VELDLGIGHGLPLGIEHDSRTMRSEGIGSSSSTTPELSLPARISTMPL
jgi:hypothetical protein